jgi:3-hydroxyacyl-[acyl-carrier-protein] dehydratase
VRFLLVDRILALSPGESVIATRRIDPDDDYFLDHFPGFPVVPGVLLTEMMGQAAAKCLAAEDKPRGRPMLVKILSATFRQWVRPGEDVELRGTITSNADRYATADCEARVGGRAVAQAKLFFSFVPHEQFAGSVKDEVLETYLRENPQ